MPRVRHVLLALVATAVCAVQLHAQTGTITGQILDAGTRVGLPVVSVTVADRNVRSDAEGRFVFAGVPAGTYTLRAAIVGYREAIDTITVAAGRTTNVEIVMQQLVLQLDALVVVGYGEQEQGDLTGVVEAVTAEEFNTGRVVSPEQLIQGKVAGVDVIDSGEPGGGVSIRIRGGTSITSSNDPLIVLDGVPLAVGGGVSAGRNPLNFLNPQDILSMTVLKDAASTAIYGSQGANGVILIETRGGRGSIGGQGSRLTYTGTFSGSVVSRRPEVLTATQFRSAVEEFAPAAVPLLGNASTDWRDRILQTGIGQEHSLAFAGATDDFDYRLSVGYLKQEGIVRGTVTERTTVGLGFGHFFFDDRVHLTANLRGARMADQFTPGGVVGGATAFAPTQRVRNPGNDFGGFFEWEAFQQALNNPIAELRLTEDNGTTFRSVGDLQADIEIPWVQGLSATVRVGYDVTKAERETFRPSFLRGEAEGANPGFVSRSNSTGTNLLLDAFGTYDRTFGAAEVELTAGYAYFESDAEFPYFEARGLSFDLLGTNGVPAANEQRTTIFVDESKLASFFGRANITLSERYLLTLSARRDGSSKFGVAERWATFPAVAVAWRLSNESFLSDWESLSDLKLRVSWGENGNSAFANYQQFPSYDIGDQTAQYQFGNEFVTTIRPGAADRNIKWEQTASYNIGLDFGFANQRWNGQIDYYQKKTEDLIFRVPVAAGTFTSNFITTNIGSLENSGIEFSVNAALIQGFGEGFSWDASFNVAKNTNEITAINPFGGGEVILTGGISGGVGNNVQVLQPGQPINSFYVFEHRLDGSGLPIYEDRDGDGDIDDTDLYVDRNDDGIVNQDDRRPYQSPAPDWIMGFTSRFGLGGFDASFTMRAHVGNYVYNNVASNNGHYRALSYVGAPNNLHASVLESQFESEQYFSDYYVEDASFLKMDNLTVGYTFRSGALAGWRVFGVVQNVFTLTGYSGVDPLAGVNGIDNNLYPRSRTFTAGASVRFGG